MIYLCLKAFTFLEPNDVNSVPATPRRVFLPRIDSQKCSTCWKREIHDNLICAGGEKGKDSCTEDSGNPLLRHIGNQIFAEGIVSGGAEQCGSLNLPGIYIYIPKFIDWIKYNIKV